MAKKHNFNLGNLIEELMMDVEEVNPNKDKCFGFAGSEFYDESLFQEWYKENNGSSPLC